MTANAKNNTKVFEASILGTMAFNNGLKRIPCIDDKLISLQYRSIGKKKIYKFYNFSQIYKTLMNLELKEEEL